MKKKQVRKLKKYVPIIHRFEYPFTEKVVWMFGCFTDIPKNEKK